MLFPKRVKYRRWQSHRRNKDKPRVATRGVTVQYGSYALKAVTSARVTSNQIESARKTVSRTIGKLGKYWIRIFPDRPITRKAAEVPMGQGKGAPAGFCVDVLPGRIVFELDNVTEEVAHDALRKASAKLPVKTRIVGRGIE